MDGTVTLLKSPEQTSGVSQHSWPSGPSTLSLPVLRGSGSCRQTSVSSSIFSGPSAFLGPTSFSAVFNDHRDNFEPVPSTNTQILVQTPITAQPHHSATTKPVINPDLIILGMKVLMQIPNEAVCEILFSRHINPNDGWIRLAGERLSSSIWPIFGRVLAKRDAQEIEALVQLICENTNSEPRDEDDPAKWFESFSGLNIRWEALGILFTYWSFGAVSSTDNDSIFSPANGNGKERRDVMVELKECAASCIAFCSRTDHGNPLLVYLLYKHSLLETMISGDASEFSLVQQLLQSTATWILVY